MSKIIRATQQIFASGAGLDQIGQFGSLAAGSPTFTTDPDTIQALSNYLTGWFGGVVGDNSPAIEDMNAICYLYAYQLAYILQSGVAEWDSATTYYIGSMVQSSSSIYVSIIDTNLNNAVTDATKWKVLSANPFTTLGDTLYSAANGVPTRLAGFTSAARAVLAQTGTGSGSAAPSWLSLPSGTSSTSGGFTTTATSATNIAGLSVALTTTGGDVLVSFYSDGLGANPVINSTASSGAEIRTNRDSGSKFWYSVLAGVSIVFQPGGFNFIDTAVPAGSHLWLVQGLNLSAGTLSFENIVINCRELI